MSGKQNSLLGVSVTKFSGLVSAGGDGELKSEHEGLMKEHVYINHYARHIAWSCSDLPGAVSKNRFENAVLFDEGAVLLKQGKEDKSEMATNYIHATRIAPPGHLASYILTQAPTEESQLDFCRMLWQYKTIVVVCDMGNSVEFTPYFDAREKKKLKIQNRFVFKTISVKKEGWLVRHDLRLKNFNPEKGEAKERVIQVINATNWAADRPFDAKKLAALVRAVEVEEQMASTSNDGRLPPVVIHGAAGIRRSGCLVVACICAKELRVKRQPRLFETIEFVRRHRYGVLKQKSIFVLLIEAVFLLCKEEGLRVTPQLLAIANKKLQEAQVKSHLGYGSR